MGRSITINAAAKKGAAHRALKRATDLKLAQLNGEDSGTLWGVIEAARAAANKIIPVAGRADHLHIQLHVAENPVGGWEVSILIDNPAPTFPGR